MAVTRRKVGLETASAAFLGVARSARGFEWRERLSPAAANTATAISQRHGLPELLGRILAARGIALDAVAVTLEPTLKALMPDPSTLKGMERGLYPKRVGAGRPPELRLGAAQGTERGGHVRQFDVLLHHPPG